MIGSLTTAIALTATLLTAGPSSVPWEEVNDDDGIKVWARDVKGSVKIIPVDGR